MPQVKSAAPSSPRPNRVIPFTRKRAPSPRGGELAFGLALARAALLVGHSARAVARWLETEGAAGLTADVARRVVAKAADRLRAERRAAVEHQLGAAFIERVDTQIKALRRRKEAA